MTAIFSEQIPGGAMWSMRVARNRILTLKALAPHANVSALFFNASNPLDRLNIPDTLKALHTAKITKGHVLMSDMGHALASVVEDTLGWHDPLAGYSTPEMIRTAFGEGSYQEKRNDFLRNSHDNFLIELNKHDLGIRDLVACINFFSKVCADEAGRLHFETDHCKEGESVTLRAEMDLLVVLSNAPHPLHPPGEYPRVPVEVTVAPTSPAQEKDFCRTFRPECTRAMALTERLYL
jgi:urea carboxylase-associated protein 2